MSCFGFWWSCKHSTMVKRYSLRSATSSVRSLNHILFSSVRVCVYLPTCHIGFLISFLSWQQFTAKCLLMTGTKYPRKRRSNLSLPHSDTPAIPVWHTRKKNTHFLILFYPSSCQVGPITETPPAVEASFTPLRRCQGWQNIITLKSGQCKWAIVLFPFKLNALVALHNVLY